MQHLQLLGLCLAATLCAQAAKAELWYMHTRANNIQCEMGGDPEIASMMCSLTRRAGPLAQPKPADCDALWGHSYFLSERGPVQMLCRGRWTSNWPGNFKFEIGPGKQDAAISCTATRNTLQCTNRDGHGFYLSRRDQRVF